MSERLPAQLQCGAQLADLLEQVSTGQTKALTPHQIECPYCTAALNRLVNSWQDIERLRAEPVQPSPELLHRVMRRIWAGLDDWQVELRGGRGMTRVSTAVLSSLAFWAAAAAPGVRQVFQAQSREVGIEGPDRPKKRRQRLVSRENLRIEIELSIHYGFSALVVAEQVRRAVIAHVLETTGLDLPEVELTIADVG
ncbi:MAG: Asp23/Gls24 family envelope stress response protein [Candidatus Dormibacteraeota bacterium]|uniref:Asp23/Gls24 family envelope stress response protein n=1 Tax=Candidatus Dormiibacter inghamiae TaxID=3127013 RepID=A0A934K9U5_9BACT|nr:Asp23/Gls24 family envelope stress response protein [Candidatus Dormibacteraeota bacterium]MBJ7606887.1 Asp23/Gls24 family envelope stress response protein [Candidatus Dormibacteraeota bacterium]